MILLNYLVLILPPASGTLSICLQGSLVNPFYLLPLLASLMLSIPRAFRAYHWQEQHHLKLKDGAILQGFIFTMTINKVEDLQTQSFRAYSRLSNSQRIQVQLWDEFKL